MPQHIRDLFNLSGRVALITGGATGLGSQMAEALAESGAAVALASRREELCAARAEDLARATGARTAGLRLDVSVKRDVERCLQDVERTLGPVDIAVINAGISGIGAGLKISEQDWRDTIDCNLNGAFWCAQAAAISMAARGKGAIVTIASIFGFRATDGRIYVEPGQEPLENPSFAASKGGLIQLTRSLAASWARHGIRVNCISPGAFMVDRIRKRLGDAAPRLEQRWSQRTPLGRMGDTDDLKGAVVYLASDASKYVTGHNLVVDGGWNLW
jgi:gluconate 5-dehydrogenase